MRSIKNNILLLILFLASGCGLLGEKSNKTPVAQVYQKVLYLQDIPKSVYKGKSGNDSLSAVRQYIEDWAYQNLMIEEAKRNIDTLKINKLVKRYKEDLLTDTYKDLLLQKYLDTVIPIDTLQKYYEKDKAYFTASEPLISPKYLIADKSDKKIAKYKKWFFSSKPEWQDSLIKNSIHFKDFDLSGNQWYVISDFKQKFKPFSKYRDVNILKKSKKFVLSDTLSLYLVFVNNVVGKDQALPLGFIKDDMKRLILNKRKQKGLSRLQQELKAGAIQHKHYKIFKINKTNE